MQANKRKMAFKYIHYLFIHYLINDKKTKIFTTYNMLSQLPQMAKYQPQAARGKGNYTHDY